MPAILRKQRREQPPPPLAADSDHQPIMTEPTAEEIRQRAYAIFLSHGGTAGDPMSDWLQAERELRAEWFAKTALSI